MVTAVVTTRHGGVSSGDYASLNLGDHVGDDHEAVLENRRRLAAALGVGRLTVPDQQHQDRVAVVDATLAGQGHDGTAESVKAFPATDALISNLPGTALTILVADCAPVVLFDPVRRALGVVHCGRGGLVRGVLPRALVAMTMHYGTAPADLRVGIGPAISAASYEIGDAQAAEVSAMFGDTGAAHADPPRPLHPRRGRGPAYPAARRGRAGRRRPGHGDRHQDVDGHLLLRPGGPAVRPLHDCRRPARVTRAARLATWACRAPAAEALCPVLSDGRHSVVTGPGEVNTDA